MEGGNDVLVAPPELSSSDIKEALLALARVLSTQANFSKVPRVNVVPSTMTSRLRDFVRMNPPIFLFSKVREYPQMFQDRVYKVLSAIGVTSSEKAKLESYQLRDVLKYITLNGRTIGWWSRVLLSGNN